MASLKLNHLRKLIAEEVKRSLVEVEEKEKFASGEDSLDNQVDRYLISYESESKNVKNEGKDFRMMVRRFLSEAEEEEEEKKEEEKKPEKLTEEDIDIDAFLNEVMRLVDNYDALLEIRNTILRRAINFLVKGYEPTVAIAFKTSLSDAYDIEIGKSKAETEDDEFESPTADRAGASPGA